MTLNFIGSKSLWQFLIACPSLLLFNHSLYRIFIINLQLNDKPILYATYAVYFLSLFDDGKCLRIAEMIPK